MYSEDGETRDLPDFSTISHRRNLVTTTLELNVLNVRVRCWFREDDELDLDLLPDDVDSEAKAEGIFSLMRTISEVLRKRVLLTGENSGATQQWSEEHAIVAFNPPAEFSLLQSGVITSVRFYFAFFGFNECESRFSANWNFSSGASRLRA